MVTSATLVKAGIEGIEVFAVQAVGGNAQSISKPLEVHDFLLPEELDYVVNFRTVG